MRIYRVLLIGVVLLAGHRSVFAQQKPGPKSTPPKVAPAAPLKDGWEEIDKRLLFLMVRLANVEASLDAVEKKLGVNTRQQAARAGDAKRAQKGNDMMDRKGGGPVKWSEFYGRTAEKFFYHPTDRNTTYHTTTILGQRSPVDDNQLEPGLPSRQGLPVHQRPPQFDYIYKANSDAKARAEQDAAQLRNKVDALQARRRQLEDEQAALWCQIAFRAVTRYDFARKPLFRFEPTPAAADTASRQQAEAVKAVAIFMRRGLSIVEEAEKDQARAFGSIKTVIADANEKLDDSLLQLDTLTADTSSHETAIGRFSALARRLKDIADNISDSYEVSIDGDRFKDEVRKDTFRGLLQESLVDYAEVMLAMNEMALLMQSEAKTKPDVNSPLKFVRAESPERMARTTAVPDTVPKEALPKLGGTPAATNAQWRIELEIQTTGDGTLTFGPAEVTLNPQAKRSAKALSFLPSSQTSRLPDGSYDILYDFRLARSHDNLFPERLGVGQLELDSNHGRLQLIPAPSGNSNKLRVIKDLLLYRLGFPLKVSFDVEPLEVNETFTFIAGWSRIGAEKRVDGRWVSGGGGSIIVTCVPLDIGNAIVTAIHRSDNVTKDILQQSISFHTSSTSSFKVINSPLTPQQWCILSLWKTGGRPITMSQWHTCSPVAIQSGIQTALEGSAFTVTQVEPESLAARAGVSVGDSLLRIDGAPFRAASQLQSKIGELRTLKLSRSGRPVTVTWIAE